VAEKVARVVRKDLIAPDVYEVDARWVSPPEVTFRAGQFVSLRCDGSGNTRRSYSIASSPSDTGGIELLVKLVPGGLGSALFRDLEVGHELHGTGPMGFFVNELRHGGDVVYAATGTGLAAALPMVQETLARPNEHGRVILYWGMRTASELYWLDRLERLAHPRLELHVCLSRATDVPRGGPLRRGRITSPVLAVVPTLASPIVYLVGNGDMVKELKDELVALGLDRRRQVRTEVFYPATKRGE
jgi:NAD(P)H-flavin reductase